MRFSLASQFSNLAGLATVSDTHHLYLDSHSRRLFIPDSAPYLEPVSAHPSYRHFLPTQQNIPPAHFRDIPLSV